jgi:hypothetical protein
MRIVRTGKVTLPESLALFLCLSLLNARWIAAGLMEAEKGFRRATGYRQLPMLVKALCKHTVPQSFIQHGENSLKTKKKAAAKIHGGWDVPHQHSEGALAPIAASRIKMQTGKCAFLLLLRP